MRTDGEEGIMTCFMALKARAGVVVRRALRARTCCSPGISAGPPKKGRGGEGGPPLLPPYGSLATELQRGGGHPHQHASSCVHTSKATLSRGENIHPRFEDHMHHHHDMVIITITT